MNYRRIIIFLFFFLFLSIFFAFLFLSSYIEISQASITLERCQITVDGTLLRFNIEWLVKAKSIGGNFFFIYPIFKENYFSPDNIQIFVNNTKINHNISEDENFIQFNAALSKDKINLIRIRFEQFIKENKIVIPVNTYGNFTKEQGIYNIIFEKPVEDIKSSYQPTSVKRDGKKIILNFQTIESKENIYISFSPIS